MLKIKICGMRQPANISEVSALKPDFMGFIFYPKSPRFVADISDETVKTLKKNGIEPVAVSVNDTAETVLERCRQYGFEYVQLHGSEDVAYCRLLKNVGLHIIKAFQIADANDMAAVSAFEHCCDYFLFDTATVLAGGSGKKFDWQILSEYKCDTPFFLSGGIGLEDVESVDSLAFEKLYGLDLNSRFEISPAQKNAEILREFMNKIKNK